MFHPPSFVGESMFQPALKRRGRSSHRFPAFPTCFILLLSNLHRAEALSASPSHPVLMVAAHIRSPWLAALAERE